ncbi:MAG: hypothetical protein ACI9Z4_000134 [Polaribacter sp.]|jgi:hypothetical protein
MSTKNPFLKLFLKILPTYEAHKLIRYYIMMLHLNIQSKISRTIVFILR